MLMANIKKVVAMLLAVLMIFSSMSVLASAEGADTSEVTETSVGTVSVITKFYRANGDEISNDGKVAPGEKLKARVFVGTDFTTVGNVFLFYYDKEFFDVNYSTTTSLTSNNSAYTVRARADLDAYSETTTGSEGTIRVVAKANTCQTLNVNDWLFEFDLTVADDAATADNDAIGSLYLKETNLATPTNQDGYDTYSYSESSTYSESYIKYSYQFKVDTAYSFNTVTVKNTVTFKAGTEENAKEEIVTGVVGEACSVPTFTKDNYTLIAWQSEKGEELAADATTFTMPNIDGVVYTAVWSTKLTVKFDTDGATSDAIPDLTGHYSGEEWKDAVKPSNPTKTVDGYDYAFMGWMDANGELLEALPDEYPAVTVAGATYTYTAKWEKIVNVTFYSEGAKVAGYTGHEGTTWVDSTATPKYVLDNNTQGAISTVGKLERTGYSFVGWDEIVDGKGDGKADELSDKYPSENVSYTAIWKADSVTFNYYFDNSASIQKDGSIDKDAVSSIISSSSKLISDESHSYGSTFKIPEITEGEYVITSWVDADGNVYTAGNEYTVAKTGIVKLAASATELKSSGNLTATFDPDGGTIDTLGEDENYVIANLKFGDVIEKPTTVTKTGYVFLGWEPDQDTMGETNMTFTAIWAKQEHAAVFMFDNGTGSQSITYAYGDKIVAPVDPEREGYTFAGWDDDNDGVADYTAETIYEELTMGTEDMLFKAIWEAEEYTITYYNDTEKQAQIGDADSVKYFGVIEPKAQGTAEKTGYTHTGWIYYGETGEEYAQVVFNPDGAVGYTGGTRDDDDQLVILTSNLVAVATFEINSYTVTTVFDNGDANIDSTFDYDAVIENEVDPEKDGYIFTGWKYTDAKNVTYAIVNADGEVTYGTADSNGQLRMPAYDLTATAQWNIESYDLTYDFNGNGTATKIYSANQGTAVPYNTNLSTYQPANPTWVGHTFNGWNYADEDGVVYAKYVVKYAEDGTATGSFVKGDETVDTITMPAYNLVATAQWTVNKYKLTYKITGDVDAGTISTVDIAYNDEVTVAAVPTHEGYVFNDNNGSGTTYGWDVTGISNVTRVPVGHKFNMPANDVTLEGSFDIQSYTVVKIIDGKEESRNKYVFNTKVELDTPTKEGYEFSGWTVTGATLNDDNKSFNMPANEVTLEGTFKILKYKLNVDPDNGEEKTVMDVEYNSSLGNCLPGTPASKTGYEFKGWEYTDAEGTLYGKYFVSGNSGYFTDASGKTVTQLNMPAKALNCKAIWSELEYTVKFLKEEKGNVLSTATVKIGGTITVPTGFSKVGYQFAGWDKGEIPETLTAEFITANADSSRVITIVGLWNVLPYTVTYKFDNGTTEDVEKTINYGEDIKTDMPANPTRTGYTFVKWNYAYVDGSSSTNYGVIDKDGNASGNNVTSGKLLMPHYALTATAIWDANTYTYTFDANKGTFASSTTQDVTAEYDVNITKEIASITANPPTRYGYTFKGWATKKDATAADVDLAKITTMALTENVTYYAVWEINKWTITYKVDGEVYTKDGLTNPVEVEYNSTNTLIAEPSKDGYKFSGWSSSSAGFSVDGNNQFKMPNNDVVITGTFSAGAYSITYMSDNAQKGLSSYNMDAVIDNNVEVSKEGHTFTGWVYTYTDDNNQTVTYGSYVVTATDAYYTDAAGNKVTELKMPAYNLTATAQWTVNTYTVTYTITGIEAKGKSGSTETIKDVAYGTSLTAKTVATDENFTFNGWTVEGLKDVNKLEQGAAFTMPAGDVKLSGYWEAKPYTITFNANGGTFSTGTTVTVTGTYKDDVTKGIESVISNKPTYEYKTFRGWADTKDATSPQYYAISSFTTELTGDRTYYAVWKDTEYYFYYDYIPNSAGDNQKDIKWATSYNKDEEATVPAPSHVATGYKFIGWYNVTGIDGVTELTPGQTITMPGNDVHLEGRFEKIKYTINFSYEVYDPNTEKYVIESTDTQTKVLSESITLSDPTKTGYNYKWYVGDSTSSINTSSFDRETGVEITNDVITTYFADSTTLTLHCKYTPKLYQVSYYGADDKYISDVSGKYSYSKLLASIEPTTDPTKDGYEFVKWNYYTAKDKRATYTGKAVTDAMLYAYAEFTPIEYTLTFDANNGTFSDTTITKSFNAYYDADITNELSNITAPTRVGYKFLGWATENNATAAVEVPTTMSKTMTYYAVWQKETYNVNLNVDGVVTKNTYTYGAELTEPTASKDGYDFDGWFTEKDGGTEVTFTENGKVKDLGADGAEITAYAHFTAKTYTATFYFNDGTAGYYNTQAATDEAIKTPENNPERTGYTFEGWAESENATKSDVVVFGDAVVMPANGKKYYAVWTAIKVDVIFNANNGAYADDTTERTSGTQADYDSATILDTLAKDFEKPTRTGYKFLGWSRNKLSTAADTTLGKVNSIEAITVYAVWGKISYDLVIDPNNGKDVVKYTAATDNAIPYGDSITGKIENVSFGKAGYEFTGLDANGDGTADYTLDTAPKTMPANNLTLTAIYKAQKQSVTFDAGTNATFASNNSQTLVIEGGVETDANITTPAEIPTRAGYTFAGWDFPDADGKYDGTSDAKADEVIGQNRAGGVVIKAIWDKGTTPYKVEYYYADIFNDYSSTPNKTEERTYESDAEIDLKTSTGVPSIDPEDDDAYFLDEGKSVLKGIVSSTETLVLKVYFKRKAYDVTFAADGGYFNGDTTLTADQTIKDVINGATFTAPTVDRTGYKFMGWKYNETTYSEAEVNSFAMPTYPITFTAVWEPGDFGVFYEFKGVVIDSDTAKYDKTYTVKSITEGEYIITKWTIKDTTLTYDAASADNNSFVFKYEKAITLVGDPDTAQAGDYTATFNPNSGTFPSDITTDANGNYVVEHIASGEQITAPAKEPTRKGYTFQGWDAEVATMGTSNVTFNALWAANEITVTYYDTDGTTELDKRTVTVGDSIDTPVVDTESKTLSYWEFTYTDSDNGTVTMNVYGNEKMPVTDATSIKAVAVWDNDTFKVTFKLSGGTITGGDLTDGDYVVPIQSGKEVKNSAPKIKDSGVIISKAGYELVGWDAGTDGVADYDADFEPIGSTEKAVVGSDDLTYTAIWTEATYVVRYHVDGTVQNYDNGYYVKDYTVLPYEDGDIKVTEWTYNSTTVKAGDVINNVPTTVTAIDLYAVQAKHSAIFNPNGGTFPEGTKTNSEGNYVISGIAPGEEIPAPVEPTKVGYTLSWEPALDSAIYMGETDITFKAVWTPKTISVTYYDTDEKSVLDTGTVTVGESIDLPIVDTESKTLLYWKFTYTNAEGKEVTEDIYGNEIMPATDATSIKAVAVWENDAFKVTFNANGGVITKGTETTESYVVSINSGDAVKDSAPKTADGTVIIARDKYDLVGWDAGTDGVADYDADFAPIGDNKEAKVEAEDLTYTAIWKESTYTVKYYVNGDVKITDTAKYTEAYTIKSYTEGELVITKWTYDGKTYNENGKIENLSTTVKVVELVAVQDTHTATFKANGGTFKDVETNEDGDYVISGLKFGDTVTPVEPTRFGYDFNQWDKTVNPTMGNDNVTYTAQWVGKTLNVKCYDSDEETLLDEDTYDVTVGTNDYTELPDVSKGNAEFDHWKLVYTDENGQEQSFDVYGDPDSDAKMPAAEELKAVAVWSYTITYNAGEGAFPETVETETDGTYIVGSLSEGADITKPAENPTQDGKTFTGWKYYKVGEEGNTTTEEYTGEKMPAYNLVAVAQYSDAAAEVVKLMPAKDTVMIERGNGAVETNCTTTIEGFNGTTKPEAQRRYAPNGVKSVEKAYSDVYDRDGKYTVTNNDYSTWFVYGLTEQLTVNRLDEYIKVVGGGYYEVRNNRNTKITGNKTVATGLTINVYNAENKLIEKFYIVIFGDVNRDGKVNDADATAIKEEINFDTEWSVSGSSTYAAYLARAANVSGDDKITDSDATVIAKYKSNDIVINQTTGRGD